MSIASMSMLPSTEVCIEYTASVISMQLPVLCHCLHDPMEYLRPPLSTQMQQLVFKELSFNPLFPPFGFLLFWAMVPQFPRSKDEELLGI